MGPEGRGGRGLGEPRAGSSHALPLLPALIPGKVPAGAQHLAHLHRVAPIAAVVPAPHAAQPSPMPASRCRRTLPSPVLAHSVPCTGGHGRHQAQPSPPSAAPTPAPSLPPSPPAPHRHRLPCPGPSRCQPCSGRRTLAGAACVKSQQLKRRARGSELSSLPCAVTEMQRDIPVSDRQQRHNREKKKWFLIFAAHLSVQGFTAVKSLSVDASLHPGTRDPGAQVTGRQQQVLILPMNRLFICCPEPKCHLSGQA